MFVDISKNEKSKAIAVFDSGLGGLNFLKKAQEELKSENFIYFGDTKNSPYGDKSTDKIIDNAINAAEYLMNYGIKALVVACNTATNIAIKTLREKYPQFTIVGMEPAVKPAEIWLNNVLRNHSDANVVVISTEATAHSANVKRLVDLYSSKNNDIYLIGCSGLVELIEGFDGLSYEKLDKVKLDLYFSEHVDKFMDRSAQALVLGCTHYIFLSEYLKLRYPQAEMFDGDFGTLHNLQNRLKEKDLLNNNNNERYIKILCSGDDSDIFCKKAKEFLNIEE